MVDSRLGGVLLLLFTISLSTLQTNGAVISEEAHLWCGKCVEQVCAMVICSQQVSLCLFSLKGNALPKNNALL